MTKPWKRSTMMDRRQFVYAGAAGLVLSAQIPKAFAASYDLLIKGGRVIDPSAGLDAVRDLAISGGRIVAVAENIPGDATETIDAHGKVVTPGLIDIHTHAGLGKDGPPMCLQDGVTAWVDAGSGGADNIDQVAAVARGARKSAASWSTSRGPASSPPAANCMTSTWPMSRWRKAPSPATGMSWWASRRGCRTMSRAPTIWRLCGAPRKRPLPSICR